MKLIKMLVLTGMATLALSAVAAAGASAAQFQASSYPSAYIGSGEGSSVWQFEGQVTKCADTGLQGDAMSGPSSTVSLAAFFGKCTFFNGTTEGVVSMEGCKYSLGQPAGSGPFTGNVSVACPEGKRIVLNWNTAFGKCRVEIGSQTLAGAQYSNEGNRIHLVFSTGKLTYTKTIDTGICPLNGTGEVKEAGSLSFVSNLYGSGGTQAFIG